MSMTRFMHHWLWKKIHTDILVSSSSGLRKASLLSNCLPNSCNKVDPSSIFLNSHLSLIITCILLSWRLSLCDGVHVLFWYSSANLFMLDSICLCIHLTSIIWHKRGYQRGQCSLIWTNKLQLNVGQKEINCTSNDQCNLEHVIFCVPRQVTVANKISERILSLPRLYVYPGQF